VGRREDSEREESMEGRSREVRGLIAGTGTKAEVRQTERKAWPRGPLKAQSQSAKRE